MTTLISADVDWRKMSQQERDARPQQRHRGRRQRRDGRRLGATLRRDAQAASLPISTSDTARASATASIFSRPRDKAPTLLFIHGGYWQNRAKEVFSIFAEGPMAHGINVALIGYTLAPDATLDEIVAEIHAGIDYLAGQLPALGAAAGGIVVSGWSAGGHLTSMALSNPNVRAGMAISGIYDLEPIRHSYLNEKLRLDEATSRRNSPMDDGGRTGKTAVAGGRQRRVAAAAQADRRFCRPSRESTDCR